MNVLSLFDGMSCGQQALDRCKIKVDNYFASEIDKHAISVTMNNFPNTKQLGSVTQLDGYSLPKIDLLIGGSPCQSFSFAGKRKGMVTKCEIEILTLEHYLDLKKNGYEFEGQSYLFWEFVRILKEVKPKFFLLENVKMIEKWETIISKTLGVNAIEINSSLVSAQNRKRLYWTNIGLEPGGLFGDLESTIKKPKDKKINLKQILEQQVDNKYFLSDKMIKCLNKRKGTTYDTFYSADIEGKARSINSRLGKMSSGDNYIIYNMMPRSGDPKKGGTGLLSRSDGKTYCLDTGSTNAIEIGDKVRRLTPLECERLQNVKDNYTAFVSDSQRYKMLGNGWTIDVIAHILSYGFFK